MEDSVGAELGSRIGAIMGLWSEGMNPGTLAANSVSLANNFLSKPYRFKAKWSTEKHK